MILLRTNSHYCADATVINCLVAVRQPLASRQDKDYHSSWLFVCDGGLFTKNGSTVHSRLPGVAQCLPLVTVVLTEGVASGVFGRGVEDE